jgi:hypothetical protein
MSTLVPGELFRLRSFALTAGLSLARRSTLDDLSGERFGAS